MNNVVKAVLVALGVSFLIGALIPNVIAAGLAAIGIAGIAPTEAIAAITLVICLLAFALQALPQKTKTDKRSEKSKDGQAPQKDGGKAN